MRNFISAVVATIICVIAALYGGDLAFSMRASGGRPGGLALDRYQTTIVTFDLYPFSGWHIQPNFHHKGPWPFREGSYEEFDFKTGDLGFNIDFDIYNPPKKEANEYRVVVIGGSGAYGIGAQTNEKVFHVHLEKELNRRLSERGIKVRVINMAMAGSRTYQNFIDLNLYGHPLEPDVILSYAGFNDVNIGIDTEDAFQQFPALRGLSYCARASEGPAFVKTVSGWFPHLFEKTNLGTSMRTLFGFGGCLQKADSDYQAALRSDPADKKAVCDRWVISPYVEALKSIKRDFDGIPMIVASQPVGEAKEKLFDYLECPYDAFFQKAFAQLDGYRNAEWQFLDARAHLKREYPAEALIHLTNDGHAHLAAFLVDSLEAQVRKLVERRRLKPGQ